MTERRPLWGLVLAGGRSRRMGTDKALLEKDGRTQLARTVDLLERFVERVFVSARPDQARDPERKRHELIIDRYEDLGPVAGILSAMREYPDVDWLVVACDLPNVDDDTIAALREGRAADRPFIAFRSTYDDLPEPLCAIYAQGAEARIAEFVDQGVKCPRKMMIRSDTVLLTQPDPNALDNVNTPDDLDGSGARIAS